MKKSLLSLFMISVVFLSAQVGIDTTVPQQQLHISGTPTGPDANNVVGPTVRVDGLQEANNSNYVAGQEIQPVYVNADGDLMLRHNSSSFGYLVGDNLLNDDIETPVVISYHSGEFVREPIKEITFTLDAKSLVHFNHSISLNIAKDATTPLSDGIVRVVQVYFRVISSPSGIAGNRLIAADGVYYTSHDDSSTSGFVPTSGHESIILPAGTYVVRLDGVLVGNPAITNGNQSFVVEFGAWVQDEISVIAQPWPY